MMNVIIVDDELLMRIGLKSMIDWEAYGFHIVGEAANGKEAMELALQHAPELIITDIKMPVMDGIALIREALLRKMVLFGHLEARRALTEAAAGRWSLAVDVFTELAERAPEAAGAASANAPAFHRSSCDKRPRVPISVWSRRMSCCATTIFVSTSSSWARSDATRSETR